MVVKVAVDEKQPTTKNIEKDGIRYLDRKNNQRNQRNNKSEERDGLSVTVRNGDVEKALRIFKKKVQRSGLVKELRERQHYTKPSDARQEAKKRAIKRWKKKEAKLKEF